MHHLKYKEEKWNSYSHGFGLLFALIAFPYLLYNLSSQAQLFPLVIYFVSFSFLFLSSFCYHNASKEATKASWRKIDHISIFYMISGTYVPFMFAYIAPDIRYPFLTIMYALVLAGSILKIWFTGRFEFISLLLYLFLGWMIVFIAKDFIAAAPSHILWLVTLGGLAYTFGIYFYSKDERPYYHFIWHIFVLIGAILHFVAVSLI